jgi:peptidoglycan/xylan/chitin deacetylase (PgdA/CDA1 family)
VPDALVLCYHAISPSWPAALSLTPERFESQLDALRRRGYRGVGFSEAVVAPRGRVVAVTFDDAFRSVLEFALPALQSLRWPATVFVPTDHVADERPLRWAGTDHWTGTPHEHELAPMTWAQLRGLADAGWEIGSHTCTHPRLTTLSDDRLRQELSASRAACEEAMGDGCDSLAYPYGDVDARVARAAHDAGYRTAAGLPVRPGPRELLAWPRVGVYHDDAPWRFRLKTSPLVRRARTRRRNAVLGVRQHAVVPGSAPAGG